MRTQSIKAIAAALMIMGSGALQAANMAFMADQAMSRFTETRMPSTSMKPGMLCYRAKKAPRLNGITRAREPLAR